MTRKKRTEGWEHCPVCGSGQIDGHNIDIEGHYAYQNVTCLNCQATWGEEYIANKRFDIVRGDS